MMQQYVCYPGKNSLVKWRGKLAEAHVLNVFLTFKCEDRALEYVGSQMKGTEQYLNLSCLIS